jgi:hypothetical protein
MALKSFNFIILIICFIAFAICLGTSSNVPAKGQPSRITYQLWAAGSGIIGFGGLLLMMAESTARASPEGRVAGLLSSFL